MVIKYTNFSDGIHLINFKEPVESIGLEESFFGDVIVNCKMDKSPHQIIIDFDVEADTHLVCDRCNTEYDAHLKNHFQMSYLFIKSAVRDEDYNVKYLSPDEDKIRIDDDVFDYIELSIPMKKLCKEDCKGLCPKCGANLNEMQCQCNKEINIDIWEPLNKLNSNN